MSQILLAQNLNVPENGPMTAPPPTMQTQPGNVGSNHFWRNIFYLVRDIKPPNNQSCFSQFFPRIFNSFISWKINQTFYWSKIVFFSVLDQWKVCFLFSLLKFDSSALAFVCFEISTLLKLEISKQTNAKQTNRT